MLRWFRRKPPSAQIEPCPICGDEKPMLWPHCNFCENYRIRLVNGEREKKRVQYFARFDTPRAEAGTMRCETCQGWGRTRQGEERNPFPPLLPCPDCGGSGVAHCCEGERPDCAQEQKPGKPGGAQ